MTQIEINDGNTVLADASMAVTWEDGPAIALDPSPSDHERVDGLLDLVGLNGPSLEITPVELESLFAKLSCECSQKKELYVQKDQFGIPHPHAATSYDLLTLKDYTHALRDLLATRHMAAPEINFHIPNEILFESQRNIKVGERFMNFVDGAAKLIGVKVVWENAVMIDISDWSLIENHSLIPENRRLCLDTGHLILGAKDQSEACKRVEDFLTLHGDQIKHLHLHVNDLEHDWHWNQPELVEQYLGSSLLQRLISGRSYLFEGGSNSSIAK
jgi:hypothetical protein